MQQHPHLFVCFFVCLKLCFENSERHGGTVLSPLISGLEKGLKIEINKKGNVSITQHWGAFA